MQINSFDIDVSDMPAAQTIRNFVVTGDIGAEFKIIALQNPASSSTHTLYYDFNTKSFESGHNDVSNNLNIKLTGSSFTSAINFPSGGGGEYVIKLIATNGTSIAGLSSNIITKSITKAAANATITFTPGTLAANAGHYTTLPTSTSSGAIGSTGTVDYSWNVTNSATEAKSFGFIIEEGLRIDENFWYVEQTENVVDNPQGDGEDTSVVEVADLTGIAVGMDLKYYKGTTAPELNSGSSAGDIRVLSIDTSSKTITFTGPVGFDEGQTMTFRGYGASNINNSTGCLLTFSFVGADGLPVSSTLRDDSDGDLTPSTTVRLGATQGISGGNIVTYIGEGVDNSSTNTVTSVTPDPDGTGNDGAMVVTLTQTLRKGTVLSFVGSHAIINFNGTINIENYPSANTTVYLDLEKIITLGTAS